jgi:hypothetical protein
MFMSLDQPRRNQISVGGIFCFISGIAVAFHLLHSAAVAESGGFVIFFYGMGCLFASIGGLVGRLRGTREGAESGMLMGVLSTALLFVAFVVIGSMML